MRPASLPSGLCRNATVAAASPHTSKSDVNAPEASAVIFQKGTSWWSQRRPTTAGSRWCAASTTRGASPSGSPRRSGCSSGGTTTGDAAAASGPALARPAHLRRVCVQGNAARSRDEEQADLQPHQFQPRGPHGTRRWDPDPQRPAHGRKLSPGGGLQSRHPVLTPPPISVPPTQNVRVQESRAGFSGSVSIPSITKNRGEPGRSMSASSGLGIRE